MMCPDFDTIRNITY